MTIAITGGGTGGHLTIAKILAYELKKRGLKTIFIGSTNGQDMLWFENSVLFDEKYFLKSSGVVNKKGISRILSLFKILALSFGCRKIFAKHDVKAVISVGGYSSAPAAFWAVANKIPLFIHEQNAEIGKINALLKRFAKRFYSSYFEPKFDYPIDEIFFKTARIRREVKTVMFLGGSQGANFINELAVKLAPHLAEFGYKIIHQCGEANEAKMREIYKKESINVELIGFSKMLHKFVESADLCISRSGASTLWELAANAVPAVFIPFPYAAGDHQYYNAKFLEQFCKIVCQSDADEERIFSIIQNFDVKAASIGLKKLIKPDGAKKIVDDIIENLKDEDKK